MRKRRRATKGATVVSLSPLKNKKALDLAGKLVQSSGVKERRGVPQLLRLGESRARSYVVVDPAVAVGPL